MAGEKTPVHPLAIALFKDVMPEHFVEREAWFSELEGEVLPYRSNDDAITLSRSEINGAFTSHILKNIDERRVLTASIYGDGFSVTEASCYVDTLRLPATTVSKINADLAKRTQPLGDLVNIEIPGFAAFIEYLTKVQVRTITSGVFSGTYFDLEMPMLKPWSRVRRQLEIFDMASLQDNRP